MLAPHDSARANLNALLKPGTGEKDGSHAYVATVADLGGAVPEWGGCNG
jgi:hypothetical protein